MASEVKKFYEFGKFRFDARRIHLEYDGETVVLPPKSLATLKVLLEEKGELVTRESLLEKIWADSFVEDANLTVAISTLRKTLSVYEDGETFIQTVPRSGYRFIADVQEKVEILPETEPIIIERHAVEQLTIEKIPSTKQIPAVAYLLVMALLGLTIITGAFVFWQGGERKAFAGLSDSRAALEAFEKGDRLLQKRIKVCESIPYFRESISADARFARAYSSLAAALAMCGDAGSEAEDSIAKALSLDANLAEAHATDGFIKMFRQWDWAGAETALRRAVALDPNSAKAHHWLAVCLSIRGRFQEAVGEIRRAIEIEPESALYYADLCQIQYFENDAVRALTACQKSLELDPDFIFTPKYLRDIYLLRHDEQKAWEYEAKNLLNLFTSTEFVKSVDETFKRGGFKAVYEKRVENVLRQITDGKTVEKNRAHYTLLLAENYACLGDRENTLYWLEQTFNGEKGTYPFAAAYIGVEHNYAFLRGDARFQAVLKKLNLAD